MPQPSIDATYMQHWLQPDWSLPHVMAYCTTRYGAFSDPPFDGFNTADHVGDDPVALARARAALKRWFNWYEEPQWLDQVHGSQLVLAEPGSPKKKADAVYTRQPGVVCAVHTADCLPIFIASASEPLVAMIHAGWRGLAAGIIEQTLAQLASSAGSLWVWLGPAIGPQAFEVGPEVRAAFLQQSVALESCFVQNPAGRWQCDIYGIARFKLQSLGCENISGGDYCTFSDQRFFSFRRTPVTGRMLSMIWLDSNQ